MNNGILRYDKVIPHVMGHSQKGQDSLIDFTFKCIGTTNKFYVEFGAADGKISCNTWYLKNRMGWSGLLLDCEFPENPSIGLYNRYITKDNICSIFSEFDVPIEHDFLCVDIDGNDYWVLREILVKYSPRVIMVEANVRFKTHEEKIHKYVPNWKWDGRTWYGASPYALKKMLNARGYTPVWIHLDDMIAVRNDVLKENKYIAPSWYYVYPKPNTALYYDHGIPMGRGVFYCLPWSEVKNDWQESPE